VRAQVFDSINRVIHDRVDKAKITHIKSMEGSDEETIALTQDVVATGNIEEWLGSLEKQMQRSLKALCERAAFQCSHMSLRDFVDSNCGQFALLGIQFNWTAQCQVRVRFAGGLMRDDLRGGGVMICHVLSERCKSLGRGLELDASASFHRG
jgi:hypothetical protein